MNVMQIVHIRVNSRARMFWTAADYDSVVSAISYLDIRTAFEAVVAHNRSESLFLLKGLMRDWVATRFRDVKDATKYIEFEVSDQETKNGFFWMPGATYWAHWHKIEE